MLAVDFRRAFDSSIRRLLQDITPPAPRARACRLRVVCHVVYECLFIFQAAIAVDVPFFMKSFDGVAIRCQHAGLYLLHVHDAECTSKCRV